MASSPLPVLPQQRPFGVTMRRDAWWIQPLVVFLILGGFVVYATWAAFQNAYYTVPGTGYLSPFYSPVLFADSYATAHGIGSWFGPKPSFIPAFLPFSPALLILPFPGLFRFTCYYYRGAYYKAFWADPISCAVGEPRKKYLGEHSFPLILQNVHRYFLYVAVIFLFILSWDVWKALWFPTAGGGTEFGIGLGTIILAVNVVFLTCYTLGCHAMRHIVGGFLDEVSKRPARKVAYDCSSCLNRWHMKWAFISLFSVAFCDVYIRLCAMGIWHDVRLF
jgi:hypothetical protein